ncbi:MAG: 50S ribosomal protein L6 [Bdellovibrionaceae bacterium]|nr:50S ribosomal protein L6 [Pseudobdellovibrionaceae bacterium]MDW8190889.1 50S ribosomal protein L6 [Pseudobdellovibrionaceae bacterium]
MSRIGKLPIPIDDKVKVTINSGSVQVQGPKGQLTIGLPAGINLVQEGKQLKVVPATGALERRLEKRGQGKAFHGLVRTLVANAVKGVKEGFSKTLELNGVGYRASVSGRTLELSLGYSHPIKYPIPEGIDIKVDKQTIITVSGANKDLVGVVAAVIRGFRPPEPYLGKGIKYQDEKIRRKVGKSGGK